MPLKAFILNLEPCTQVIEYGREFGILPLEPDVELRIQLVELPIHGLPQVAQIDLDSGKAGVELGDFSLDSGDAGLEPCDIVFHLKLLSQSAHGYFGLHSAPTYHRRATLEHEQRLRRSLKTSGIG